MWLFDDEVELAAASGVVAFAAAANSRAAACAEAVAIFTMSSTDNSGMVEGGKGNRPSDVGDGLGLRRACSCAWCLVRGTVRLDDFDRVTGVSSLIGAGVGSCASDWALPVRKLGKNLSMD